MASDNKHRWTHLADPNFVTNPPFFSVIVHSCPCFFSPNNPSHKSDLCIQNSISQEDPLSIKWLGDPIADNKSHGSLIINLSTKN